MNDRDAAAAVLANAVLLDDSAQADELAQAVAQHLSTRPTRTPRAADPAVLDRLRQEAP